MGTGPGVNDIDGSLPTQYFLCFYYNDLQLKTNEGLKAKSEHLHRAISPLCNLFLFTFHSGMRATLGYMYDARRVQHCTGEQ